MKRYIPLYNSELQRWFVFDTEDKTIIDMYSDKEYNGIIIMCDNLNQGWEYIKENYQFFDQ